jgi:type IV secretory pathway component VirB8
MEQKLEEIKKESREEADEYLYFIKKSVDDGSYFKDAINWYFFRYVTPICDRTLLIFGAIIAFVVLFFLIQMVRSAFPLVEEVPIFIQAKDRSLTFPNLINLKPKKDKDGYDPQIATVDEAVLKYLISNYVKERESFDFRRGEIEDVNNKLSYIRNISTDNEYRVFRLIMSKDNPDSPINFYGQNVVKNIQIDSIKLVKIEPKDFTQKARQYLSNKIPTEAEVGFRANTKSIDLETGIVTEKKDRYIVKIKFAFDGVKKGDKGTINFLVNGYKLYKVK